MRKVGQHIEPCVVVHFIIVQCGIEVGFVLCAGCHLGEVLLKDVNLFAIVGGYVLYTHQTRCSLN